MASIHVRAGKIIWINRRSELELVRSNSFSLGYTASAWTEWHLDTISHSFGFSFVN